MCLVNSLQISEYARTLLVNGLPACIHGVVLHSSSILDGDAGIPWSLSTVVVDRYPKEFFLRSKVGIDLIKSRYDLLFNYVDASYAKAIRWIKRLGFTVGAPVPFGHAGAPFRPFYWRKENV